MRAWWAALQSRFDTDDQPGGAIEIAMTIALIVVVVIAGLLLVVTGALIWLVTIMAPVTITAATSPNSSAYE